AGVSVVGGHSIDDAEPKVGYAVVGLVHPARIWRNVGARPGDALILTKPIGTGIISTAIKNAKAPPAAVEAAVRTMTTLNRQAAASVVRWAAAIPEPLRAVIGDAQTSGGLLVATSDGPALLAALARMGVARAAQVGEILEEDALGTIEVEA